MLDLGWTVAPSGTSVRVMRTLDDDAFDGLLRDVWFRDGMPYAVTVWDGDRCLGCHWCSSWLVGAE